MAHQDYKVPRVHVDYQDFKEVKEHKDSKELRVIVV
jgi:tetrahydromethanopterin S-methyltransferase subunit G